MGRRLGQHFLIRESTLERIARAACPEHEPLVIEIGPGQGALTKQLLPLADRVVAIEIDSELVAGLAPMPALEVIHADVLDVDLAQWGPAVVAGNLPYYVTSPILERTLSLGPLLRRAVFLIQREVAERLAAKPGSRDYGFLSVRTQTMARVEILFRVPRGAFRPPPQVDSAVVRLTPHAEPLADPRFLAFASACFRQKRKTLRNNLAAAWPEIAAQPESGLRAEQLALPALIDLWKRVAPLY